MKDLDSYKKVESEAEKKIILALLERDRESYSDIARASGLSVTWVKKKIPKLIGEGIVKEVGGKYRYRLNRGKIKVVLFSWEKMKELSMPSVIGMVLNIFASLSFGSNAYIFALGGMTVFLFQIVYSIWKIYHATEIVDVYIKP